MEEPCRPSDKLIAGPCLRMISAHWLTTGTYICRDAALSKTAAHTWGHRTARDGPRNNRGSTVAQPWLNPLYLLYSGSRYLLAVTPDSISVEIQEMNRSIDLLTARSLDQPR